MIPLPVIYSIIVLSVVSSIPLFYSSFASIKAQTTRSKHPKRKPSSSYNDTNTINITLRGF